MFTVALFTIAKIWKQPKCLSTEEWIKKIWHVMCDTHTHTHTHVIFIHIHTYNGVVLSHKNEIIPSAATRMDLEIIMGFPGGSVVKNPPANAGNVGLIPGSGRYSGEENGNPLQYSCLQNSTDREAWWATVPDKRVRHD